MIGNLTGWIQKLRVMMTMFTARRNEIILNQIIAAATFFTNYHSWTIEELTRMVYRADLDEDGQDFVERLWAEKPRSLPVRQLRRLVGLARLTEFIGRDEEVEMVLRNTRAQDDEIREAPEFVPYADSRSF